jgi:hypothetical protein
MYAVLKFERLIDFVFVENLWYKAKSKEFSGDLLVIVDNIECYLNTCYFLIKKYIYGIVKGNWFSLFKKSRGPSNVFSTFLINTYFYPKIEFLCHFKINTGTSFATINHLKNNLHDV